MARTTQSAVLSPADKKAQAAALKAEIKAAKDALKLVAGERKAVEKTFNEASKAHVAALKINDKAQATAEKALFVLTAKLDALTPTPAVA